MITKNYIKMCEQAEEIQREWKPKQFDCYYSKALKHKFIIDTLDQINIIEKYIDNYTWLLTQEQLWKEILELHFTENTELTIRNGSDLKPDIFQVSTYTEIDDNIISENVRGNTIKECFLKLLMKEYCKVWTGEKWVKAE